MRTADTQIDVVLLGCVSEVGDQGMNVARQAVLAAGFDESVAATAMLIAQRGRLSRDVLDAYAVESRRPVEWKAGYPRIYLEVQLK